MSESMGTERYCVCPTCRVRFAFPAGALEKTLVLRALEGETPALWVRGVVYCGNCGTAFMPDLAGYLRSQEVTGEVAYIGVLQDARSHWRHNVPAGDVRCQVSGRWLRFHPDSSRLTDGEFITVDVMTTVETESDSRDRKLCELIVTREDLTRALDTVRPR